MNRSTMGVLQPAQMGIPPTYSEEENKERERRREEGRGWKRKRGRETGGGREREREAGIKHYRVVFIHCLTK